MSDSYDSSPKNKKTRKGKAHLAPLSEVLLGVLQSSKSPLSHQFLRWKIWSQWPEIVGPSISAYSEPVGYHKGELYIWVQNSAQMQEMTFMATHLAKKVNEHVGKRWVRRVRVTMDRKAVPTDENAVGELKDFLSKDEKPSD